MKRLASTQYNKVHVITWGNYSFQAIFDFQCASFRKLKGCLLVS